MVREEGLPGRTSDVLVRRANEVTGGRVFRFHNTVSGSSSHGTSFCRVGVERSSIGSIEYAGLKEKHLNDRSRTTFVSFARSSVRSIPRLADVGSSGRCTTFVTLRCARSPVSCAFRWKKVHVDDNDESKAALANMVWEASLIKGYLLERDL